MSNLLKVWKKYSFLLLMAFVIIGLFDMRFALAAIVCMVAPIIVSLFKGRYWCGNLCPRGSFYDVAVSKISKKRNVPKFFRSRFLRTVMILFIFTMFTLGLYKNWGDLYGIGMILYRIIIITTIIGIVLSLFFNHRTWCYFCPMGTIASVISKYRKSKKVLQISTGCVSCRKCQKECPIGIVPYDYKGDFLSHPDCIQCGQCIKACPKNAIGYQK